MNERFNIRAVKLIECLLQTSIVKEGVTEAEIRVGIADGTIFVDMGQGEIRRGKDVLAKFGEIPLPAPDWKILDTTRAPA